MRALTMTLLPEPVAPAIRRCGIFARSAARACPATSRPRAKAIRLAIPATSGSSRIRRIATTLKSMFGISIPTTVLPGIGASMRIVRAARAIARSSASPSMRLTLIDGSGSTSYWVTTGPAFHFTTRLGMLKLASLPVMIAAFRSWSMPWPAARAATSSRSVIGGRRYSRRSGSRRPSSAMAGSGRGPPASRAGSATGPGVSCATGARAAPANTDETWAGDGSGDGISGRGCGSRPFFPLREPLPLPAPLPASPAAWRVRFGAASATRAFASAAGVARAAPTPRAPRPSGATSSRTGRSSTMTTPTMKMPRRTTNAPGSLTRDVSGAAIAFPIRPPLRSAMIPALSRRLTIPSSATYAIVDPITIRPQPARGPFARSRTTPIPMRSTGRSQRPEPNHGATTPTIQSVRAPLPGSRRPTRMTTPRTRRMMATIDRVTSGLSRRQRRPGAPGAPSAGRGRAPAGRHLDLHHDREDHRAALRLLVEVARDAVLDLALEEADLADVVAGVLDRLDDALARPRP